MNVTMEMVPGSRGKEIGVGARAIKTMATNNWRGEDKEKEEEERGGE